MTAAEKRVYQREYMRKYSDKNHASVGAHHLGRPPKGRKQEKKIGMKLTGAQITRIDEALAIAKYHSDNEPVYEPQRHRVEMLVDDILKIVGIPSAEATNQR